VDDEDGRVLVLLVEATEVLVRDDEEEDNEVDEDVLVFDELELVLDAEEILVVVTAEESLYISNLLPAPQYCTGLPGQTKLQSPGAARTDPAPRVLPQ